MELYIEPKRPEYNLKNGRFLKGHTPFNKGKRWSEYMNMRKQKKCLKNLELGRRGNPDIAGRNARSVVAIKDNQIIGIYKSAADAGRKTGICSRNIIGCCRGERKQAGGFKWYYESDNSWTTLITGKK